MTDFKNELIAKAENISLGFENAIPYDDVDFSRVKDAMLYSLQIGGKRIRPVLMTEFYALCGGKVNGVYNFAIALEMIHTYSLIHDDLPCMDNDDFRRGKPSCHKAFDEATAVLAGDGLLTEAFALASRAEGIPAENIVKAINVLAECAGVSGMIGGQIIDIQNEGKTLSIEKLQKLYSLKTGALIKAAAKIGCILAGKEDKCEYAERYAENIGLAFQIVDDILDFCGDEALLGKPIGSDEKNNKCTYVTLCGIQESRNVVEKLTLEAKICVDKIGTNGRFLRDMADYLAIRDN